MSLGGMSMKKIILSEKQKEKSKSYLRIACVVTVVIAIIIVTVFVRNEALSKKSPSVISITSIEDIIEVSELSTYTAVYNGIAEVKNEENEETDYYVSYESRIKAGIDFEEIKINLDETEKMIRLILPEVYITDATVDIATLEFIFMDEKANQSTVTEKAYKAAEEDVMNEATTQNAIYGLAEKNARNTLKALLSPLIEQKYPEYGLALE